MNMILWSISTLFGQRALVPVKISNGGQMATNINETQVRKWMNEMVENYVGFTDGKYAVDSFSLARDAYIFFTGETDAAPVVYQTLAMQIANDTERRRNGSIR